MKSIKESLDAEKEQKVKLEKVRCVCNHKQSSIITPSYIFCHCCAHPNKKGLCVIFLRDRRSVAQQCWIRLHSSSVPLFGPRTLITHGLQRLMGCILPTMHCRSQLCWELLHPFAHNCQHARSLTFILR